MAKQHFLKSGLVETVAKDNGKFKFGFHLERWLADALGDSLSDFDAGIKTDTIAEHTDATGVTIDGVLLKDGQVTTDVINEKTAAAGVTADGVLLKDGTVTVESITEKTSGAGVTFSKATIQKRTATAVNATATTTAAAISKGLITSTSAAAVALTLPTATALGTQLGAVQGTTFEFIVDNSAGANIVTVTVNTGVTAVTAVVTGSATLTVASGVVGMFRLYFTSATAAILSRVF